MHGTMNVKKRRVLMVHGLGVGLVGRGHRREHEVKEHIDRRARNNRRANIDGIIISDGSGSHKNEVRLSQKFWCFIMMWSGTYEPLN